MVLRDVAFMGETSFRDFMKHNEGLTPRVLSMRLRDLREEGLIERVSDLTDNRVVRHRITRKGRDAVPTLTALTSTEPPIMRSECLRMVRPGTYKNCSRDDKG
jgi:DNA-binding HxlR family transcriptional regulator